MKHISMRTTKHRPRVISVPDEPAGLRMRKLYVRIPAGAEFHVVVRKRNRPKRRGKP